VTRGVNNEEAGKFQIEWLSVSHDIDMFLKVIFREVSGTDLLSDTSSFIRLYVGLSQLIQDKRLSRVDVTHNTNNGTTQFLGTLGLLFSPSRFKQGKLASSSLVV